MRTAWVSSGIAAIGVAFMLGGHLADRADAQSAGRLIRRPLVVVRSEWPPEPADIVNVQGEQFVASGAKATLYQVPPKHTLVVTDLLLDTEVNEDKFGAYTPRTLIPIRTEAEVRALRPAYLLVLPWHFRPGIVRREAEYLAAGGQLVFPLPHIDVVARPAARRAA